MGADCLRSGNGHLPSKADLSRYHEAGAQDLGLLHATDAPLPQGILVLRTPVYFHSLLFYFPHLVLCKQVLSFVPP